MQGLILDPVRLISDHDCKQCPAVAPLCLPQVSAVASFCFFFFFLDVFASRRCFSFRGQKLGEVACSVRAPLFLAWLWRAAREGLAFQKARLCAGFLKLCSNFDWPEVSAEAFDRYSTEAELNLAVSMWQGGSFTAACRPGLPSLCAAGTEHIQLSPGTEKVVVLLPGASPVSTKCLTRGALLSAFYLAVRG